MEPRPLTRGHHAPRTLLIRIQEVSRILDALHDSLPRRAIPPIDETIRVLETSANALMRLRGDTSRTMDVRSDGEAVDSLERQLGVPITALELLLQRGAPCHALQIEQFIAALRTDAQLLQRAVGLRGKQSLTVQSVLANGVTTPNVLPDSVTTVSLIGGEALARSEVLDVALLDPGGRYPLARLVAQRNRSTGAWSAALPTAALASYRGQCVELQVAGSGGKRLGILNRGRTADPSLFPLCVPNSWSPPAMVTVFAARPVTSFQNAALDWRHVEVKNDSCGRPMPIDRVERWLLPPGFAIVDVEVKVAYKRNVEAFRVDTMPPASIHISGLLRPPTCFSNRLPNQSPAQFGKPSVFENAVLVADIRPIVRGVTSRDAVDSARYVGGDWRQGTDVCVPNVASEGTSRFNIGATVQLREPEDAPNSRRFQFLERRTLSTRDTLTDEAFSAVSLKRFVETTHGSPYPCLQVRLAQRCRY